MNGMHYLNAGIRHAWATYQSSGRQSTRIVVDLLALAQLCRSGEKWRTVIVTDANLDEAQALIPDPSTKTLDLALSKTR